MPDTPPGPPDDAPDDAPDDDKVDWKAEAEKWKGLSRKHEATAKANSGAAKELETLRKSSMNEQELAVAKAKEEGVSEARSAVAVERAEDAIRFSVGDRLPSADLDDLLDHLNLSKFVTDDGKVDREKVAKYVERVAPAGRRRAPDLGQGARGAGSGSDMNSFLANAIKDRRK